ncbi:hypothetical protein K0B03_04210 [Patescibacteria group bacterium]|nr:hypothetical protein [Patescibacteria group bacterium]
MAYPCIGIEGHDKCGNEALENQLMCQKCMIELYKVVSVGFGDCDY